jgi:hypothetical protein
MDIFNQSTVLASAAVLLVTELLKLVPVAFTSRYPAWVNVICSVIAAITVSGFSWNVNDLSHLFVQVLVIGVTAAMAYNHLTSKVVNLNKDSEL